MLFAGQVKSLGGDHGRRIFDEAEQNDTVQDYIYCSYHHTATTASGAALPRAKMKAVTQLLP